jgi:hypothetical protein
LRDFFYFFRLPATYCRLAGALGTRVGLGKEKRVGDVVLLFSKINISILSPASGTFLVSQKAH